MSHNNFIIYTYFTHSTITLVIISPCVVTHCLNSSTSLGSDEKKQHSLPQGSKKRPLRQSLWLAVSCRATDFCVISNKSYAMSTIKRQGLEHALKCFVLKFDGAIEIICRDQRVLYSTIVRSKQRKKGFSSRR